jgi:4-amino-4-deoxy-L-arabinose transferase-like glycosyltransferase
LVELVYILLIATIAAGVGLTLLRKVGPTCDSRAEELVFSIGLGLGMMALGVLALGLVHLLYGEVFYGLLALGALAGRKELVGLVGRLQGRLRSSRLDWRSFHFWLIAVICTGLVFNLIRALMPANGAVDPLAYHLALPKLYLLRHHISFERTLTGALYPDNVGMLYLLAIGLRDASLAQVVHWFMGATTVLAIWCFCRGYFNARVGVWAAAIYSFTPVFVFFAPLAYIDIGVGLFQFLGIWALVKWLRDGERNALVLTAIFMGLAMGAKHTSILLAVVVAFVVVGRELFKGGGFRSAALLLALYSAIAVGLTMPWYARALWEAGNPVWPVANELFGGLAYKGSYSVSAAAADSTGVSMNRIKDLLYWSVASLWEWAWNEQLGWQRATGIYYVALLPGLLAYGRLAKVRWLALAALVYYFLAVFYVDGNPRYNLALFALLSVLAGYVAEKFSRQSFRPLAWVFNGIFIATAVANIAWGYLMSSQAINYVFSHQNSDQFLLNNEGNYQAFCFVDKHLPPESKVLLQGIVKGYYCQRPYMWDHPYQMLLQYRDYKTPEELLARFSQLGITHIVRMIYIPPGRTQGVGYPQYFADAQHEAFRKRYLKLLYRDQAYVVFEVIYPS